MDGRHSSAKHAYTESEYRDRRSIRPEGAPVWLVPCASLFFAALVLILAGTLFVFYVSSLDTIFPNVCLDGVNVGGRTMTAATALMEQQSAEGYAGCTVTVELPLNESLTVQAEDIGLSGSRREAVTAAYCYGRSDSPLQNALCYIRCWQGHGINILWEGTTGIVDWQLNDLCYAATVELNKKLAAAETVIDEEAITLPKGAGSSRVDGAELAAMIREAFETRTYDTLSYEPSMDSDGTEELDELYERVYVAPTDAVYDKQSDTVSDSVTGVSFDKDEAARRIREAAVGDEVRIPLVYTEPEVDADTLREMLFRDRLSAKSTSLSGSSSARINNITLAAEAMDGTILLPGEEFNYNDCLGERTTAKGYESAGAYANGQHTTAVGGGICQGSSTLYYCALYANLEITERWDHYFAVNYLPMGLDATVSWYSPNFCFVNDRDYPIRIDAWVSDGELTVEIWGTDTDGSYVSITSDGWEDSEYYYAQTYRNVYDADGNLISSEAEAYSRYNKYEKTDE